MLPRLVRLALAGSLLLTIPACRVRPYRGDPERAATAALAGPPATTRVDPYYAASGPVPAATTRLDPKASRRAYEVVKVDLPPRTPAQAPAPTAVSAAEREQAIRMVWYRPRANRSGDEPDRDGGPAEGDAGSEGEGDGARRPAVVLSPILGSDTAFVSGVAEDLATQGWHALIVKRPKMRYEPGAGLPQVEQRLRLAVSRQVQALDWLLERPDVDGTRVGSFGISAGGIQNAMVAGADGRYRAHVLALAGGPLCDVFVDSEEGDIEKLEARAREDLHLDAKGLREALRGAIRTDPVLLAPRVDPRSVLLVLARFDHSVPTRCGKRLRRALREPETMELPLGHYTAALALPFVRSRAIAFLRRRLEEPVEADDGAPAPVLEPAGPLHEALGPVPSVEPGESMASPASREGPQPTPGDPDPEPVRSDPGPR